MQDYDATVGQRIRSRREEIGMSQTELTLRLQIAGLTYVHREAVVRIEMGHRRIRLAELVHIARALRCRITALLGEPDIE